MNLSTASVRATTLDRPPSSLLAAVADSTSRALTSLTAGALARGVVPRGGYTSLGDAARVSGGVTLAPAAEVDGRAVLSVDWQSRTAVVLGGASFGVVSRELSHAGWTLPLLARSAGSTIGGAIAQDSYSFSSHVNNRFSDCVESILLVDGQGAHRELSATHPDPDVRAQFACVIGGLGLAGVVVAATIRIEPITTAWMLVDSVRCSDLPDVLENFEKLSASHRWTYARLDTSANGRRSGRGVVYGARRATLDDLPQVRQRGSLDLEYPAQRSRYLPEAFNRAWIRRAIQSNAFHCSPAARNNELVPLAHFFGIDDSRAWGHGLFTPESTIRYECNVPSLATDALRQVVELLSGVPGTESATLSRATRSRQGVLNPGSDGWAISVDLDSRSPHCAATLDEVDGVVVGAGGSIGLAHDSRMNPELAWAIFPDLPQWRVRRSQLDPGGVFRSDLSRRLSLC